MVDLVILGYPIRTPSVNFLVQIKTFFSNLFVADFDIVQVIRNANKKVLLFAYGVNT
jgi:hypothetical protein